MRKNLYVVTTSSKKGYGAKLFSAKDLATKHKNKLLGQGLLPRIRRI